MAVEPSSFRDPSGSIFWLNNHIYRDINPSYQAEYDMLVSSGLYQALVDQHLLVPHAEVKKSAANVYKTIQPELVPVISYPYEWSFSQLKDAALTTLKIQKLAMDHGMALKDASAYNIQFMDGRPVLIDTLSFERLTNKPWVAYRQFCQHFLAPLALMAYIDFRTGQLLRANIEGIPLDLAAKMLPGKTRLVPSLLIHIHLHAASQKRHAADTSETTAQSQPKATMSDASLRGLIDSLTSAVNRLDWRTSKTEWADYYQANNNYVDQAMEHKEKLVGQFLKQLKPDQVWDLGGNTGRFSRIGTKLGIQTVCWDVDPNAVEANYRHVRSEHEKKLLPLWQDFTNPTQALGWNLTERKSIQQRGPADVVMALALIHHMAIGNNVPMPQVAEWLSGLCRQAAIVEFMPKSDSQVQKLLSSRDDIFTTYCKEGFEQAFGEYFTITEAKPIKGSQRTLYLLTKKEVAV